MQVEEPLTPFSNLVLHFWMQAILLIAILPLQSPGLRIQRKNKKNATVLTYEIIQGWIESILNGSFKRIEIVISLNNSSWIQGLGVMLAQLPYNCKLKKG